MFWLKEQLIRRAIRKLRWADTRDMSADGHTKGVIKRDQILQLMLGDFEFTQPVKDYEPKIKRNADSADSS